MRLSVLLVALGAVLAMAQSSPKDISCLPSCLVNNFLLLLSSKKSELISSQTARVFQFTRIQQTFPSPAGAGQEILQETLQSWLVD
jgi:hypothetical protein